MKPFQLLLLAALISACDGHRHTFIPPLVPGSAVGVLPADEGPRLLSVLAEVAKERGFSSGVPNLESENYTVSAFYYKKAGRGSVQIKLLKETMGGSYRFVVVDWPSSSRSAESVGVEEAICKKLKEPPKPSRPYTGP